MKFLHLTHSKNLLSIKKNGLCPSFIENESHWLVFKDFIKDKKCIYFWIDEKYKNSKYVKDMVYTKMFIHPRNRIFEFKYDKIKNENLDLFDYDLYVDFKKFGNELFGIDGTFYLLEFDSTLINYYGSWVHVQEPTSNNHSTISIMNDKFSHNDKEIFISDDVIKYSNIKIVDEIHVRKYKNQTLGFSFIKNRRYLKSL